MLTGNSSGRQRDVRLKRVTYPAVDVDCNLELTAACSASVLSGSVRIPK
jgi:hypothetical protein